MKYIVLFLLVFVEVFGGPELSNRTSFPYSNFAPKQRKCNVSSILIQNGQIESVVQTDPDTKQSTTSADISKVQFGLMNVGDYVKLKCNPGYFLVSSSANEANPLADASGQFYNTFTMTCKDKGQFEITDIPNITSGFCRTFCHLNDLATLYAIEGLPAPTAQKVVPEINPDAFNITCLGIGAVWTARGLDKAIPLDDILTGKVNISTVQNNSYVITKECKGGGMYDTGMYNSFGYGKIQIDINKIDPTLLINQPVSNPNDLGYVTNGAIVNVNCPNGYGIPQTGLNYFPVQCDEDTSFKEIDYLRNPDLPLTVQYLTTQKSASAIRYACTKGYEMCDISAVKSINQLGRVSYVLNGRNISTANLTDKIFHLDVLDLNCTNTLNKVKISYRLTCNFGQVSPPISAESFACPSQTME